METLTPPLVTAIQTLKLGIGGGQSPKDVFRRYLDENNDVLAAKYRELWIGLQANAADNPRKVALNGVYARAFWDVVRRGVAGEPIVHALDGLEVEVTRAAHAELELHLSTLPFKMLIPLLLFQFPAHLVLLLGPMLRDLTHTLGTV